MKGDLSKLTLPLAVVAALLGSAAGAGATYGATKYKLDEAADTAKQAALDVHSHEVQLAVLNTQMSGVQASLARLEQWAGTQPKGAK